MIKNNLYAFLLILFYSCSNNPVDTIDEAALTFIPELLE